MPNPFENVGIIHYALLHPALKRLTVLERAMNNNTYRVNFTQTVPPVSTLIMSSAPRRAPIIVVAAVIKGEVGLFM